MEKYSNELFLLIANLAQLKHKQAVFKLFPAALEQIFNPYKIRWDVKCSLEDENCIIICTRHNQYGCLMLDPLFPEEAKYLVQNAAQLVAVFLEGIEHDEANLERISRQGKTISEATQRFKLLYESAGVGIGYYDIEGNVLFYNNLAAQYLGGQPEDYIGKNIKDLFPPGAAEIYLKRIDHASLSDTPVAYVDHINLADGDKWFQTSYSCVKDESGAILGIQLISSDVTNQKEIQNELEQKTEELLQQNEEFHTLNEELQQTIEQLNISNKNLEKAKEMAERADQLKSAFLANMSHEIRTPMNGIIGFAELLREPDIEESERKRFLEIIDLSGERMLRLINNLIDISKIEAGQVTVSRDKVNLNDIINKSLDFFHLEAKSKGIRLVKHSPLPHSQAFFFSDIEKLQSIFTNLIKNALKHTDEGEIQFGYKLDQSGMIFYVKDTGEGIPRNKLDTIFERFTQIKDLSTKNTEGAGLGLAITKSYVDMMGGKIWIDSEPGKGSTFSFSLPLDPIN